MKLLSRCSGFVGPALLFIGRRLVWPAPLPDLSVLGMVNCATERKAQLLQNVIRSIFLSLSVRDDRDRRVTLVSNRNEMLRHTGRHTASLEIREREVSDLYLVVRWW